MIILNAASTNREEISAFNYAVNPLIIAERETLESSCNFDPEILDEVDTQENIGVSKIHLQNFPTINEVKFNPPDSLRPFTGENVSIEEVLDDFDDEEAELDEHDKEDNSPIIKTHINEDGTTSNYFDKRKLKIAPRSTLQFKVGPPFELEKASCSIDNSYTVANLLTGKTINFQIIPRIDRGFDYIDNEWVGYKRNYFTLVSSFKVIGYSLEEFLKSSFILHINDNDNNLESYNVKYFAVKIRARSDEDYTEISLVQHTAKRDKGPQFAPSKCPLIPSPLPKHQIIREASNVRNSLKMKKYDSTFYYHRDEEVENYKDDCILSTYPTDCIQKVARYERVQFASSINIKNPTQKTRHFRLHITLGAVIGCSIDKGINTKNSNFEEEVLSNGTKEIFVPIQEMMTPPLIIRGRSPSNYTSSQKPTAKSPVRNSKPTNKPFQKNKLEYGLTIVSTNKPRLRKSMKRKEVIETSSPYLKPVENDDNFDAIDDENIEPILYPNKSNRRIETLDHIENMLFRQTSLTLKSTSTYSASHYLEECDRNTEEEQRPVYSRHHSINLKDIDLNPTKNILYDNSFVVGSLVLQEAKILKTKKQGIKKRRIINKETFLTTTTTTTTTTTKTKTTNSPSSSGAYCSASSRGNIDNQNDRSIAEDLSSVSLSLLNNSLTNYCHIPINNVTEIESLPRSFARVVGESSFMAHYKQVLDSANESGSQNGNVSEENIINENSNANICLPSEIIASGELYDEPSFYNR